MRVSKFVKLSNNILLEYTYDDNNNIGYPYKVLINNQNNQNNLSFIDGTTNTAKKTSNTLSNQLFRIDIVNNTYGKIDNKNYSFLQLKDYPEGFPIRHDTIKIHLPVNYTFEEYIGFYIRVFTLDYNNKKTYELSNFYFDITDVDQASLLDLSNPSLLFQEKLWSKYIRLDIPSVDYVSNQRTPTGSRNNSVNFNLTNGFGLSVTSPIFIDFHFIKSRKTINNVTTYNLTSKYTTSLPQKPDFEKLGLKIEHSKRGDYFEIFGIYNGNVNEFNNFIMDSIYYGKKYVVEYNITLFEQNIRGKSFKILIEDNFNEKVEYRPIIKFTTTTAIIDVEMNVIDMVDGAMIQRRASYGMLQDEVAKYSLNLTKINLSRASKPKIYNINSPEGAGIFGNLNGSAYSDGRLYGNAGGSLFATNGAGKNIFGLGRGAGSGIGGNGGDGSNGNGVGIGVYRNSGIGSAFLNNRFGTEGGGLDGGNGGLAQDVGQGGGLIDAAGFTNENGLNQIANAGYTKVILEPYPVPEKVFSDRYDIIAKSDSVSKGTRYFYGIGKLKIVLTPFDQFVKFILATTVSPLETRTAEYMDLTNVGEIKLVFKNTKNNVEFGLFLQTKEVDISKGVLIFKITVSKINEIRQIYNSGINVFYITATNVGSTTVLYNGLFTIYDDKANVDNLNTQQQNTEQNVLTDEEGFAVADPNNQQTGTAIVTRVVVGGAGTQGAGTGTNTGSGTGTNTGTGTNGGSDGENMQNSSVPSKITQGTNIFEIDSNSNLLVNSYSFGSVNIKKAYNMDRYPRKLSFQQSTNSINLYSDDKFMDKLQDAIVKLEKTLNAEELVKYNTVSGINFSAGIFSKPTTGGGVPDPQKPDNAGSDRKEVGTYNLIVEDKVLSSLSQTETENLKIGDLLKIKNQNFKIIRIDKSKAEIYLIKDERIGNSGQSGSGGGCPTPDMKILMGNGSYLEAANLKSGMFVSTKHEFTMQKGIYKVSDVTLEKQPIIKIIFEEFEFTCSKSHKFYFENQWIESIDLKIGQILSGKTIKQIIDLQTVGDVVRITVDDAHTYICQGILSHNKAPISKMPV